MRIAVALFSFFLIFGGVVVNEFMYNPPGSAENEEFVELLNTGPDTVNLENWTNSGKLITDAPLFLMPDSSLILAKDTTRLKIFLDSVGVFYNCCPMIQQKGGWDALSNSSDNIVIKNALGETVDSVGYSSVSCADNTGRTLERPSGVISWRPTTANCSPNIGGSPCNCTPGYDLSLVYIDVNPSTPTSEDIITLSPQVKNNGRYPLAGSLSLWVEKVTSNDTFTVDSTVISLPTIQPGETETSSYTISHLDTGLYRINGLLPPDDVPSNNSRSFYKRVEQPYHILISEILTNALGSETVCPGGACNEFIELYNFGDEPINLAGWLVTDGDETDTICPWETSELGLINREGLIYDTTVIAPKSFALILDRDYVAGNMPYNIPPGVLILTTNDNDLGNGLSDSDTIKLMTPGKSVVSVRPGLTTYAADGYSYIRCALAQSGNFMVSPVLYGTPGYYTSEAEGEFFDITVDPESFNPEHWDPQKGQTKIRLSFPRSSLYSLRIYDLKGRLVKELVREKDTPVSEVIWNGRDNNNKVVPLGVYVVVGECPIRLVSGCTLIEGARKTVKKPVVVGRPLK